MTRLRRAEMICACDFTEFFDVSQPTISAHLKTLRETGLVTSQRKGNTICYSVARDQVAGWLAGWRPAPAPSPAPVAASAGARSS